MWAVGCNVTDGNYSHSLVVFNREQLLNCFNIVVGYRLLPSRLDKAQASLALFSLLRQLSYPARAETTVSSCKAEVFNGNAKVDVAMILLSSVRTQASFRLLKHSTNIGTFASHGRL